MPKINLLDKGVYELIAAGEVIERPSSVIKELAENSLDAGAGTVTVEIKRGGITYMRVTDDGCGISYEDVPAAFMRHATSKVLTADDLDVISTLGFRGEALASVCAVGRVELVTKQAGDKFGSSYRIEGGEVLEYDHTGCSDGTTIIIRDLFFNTPARLKFLKKDVTEGNYCASVVEKLALSHPNVSFRFIRDGRQIFMTPGDGEYYGAVQAVFGRQFAAGMIPVENDYRGIGVTGYVSSPLFTRANRSMQSFFVNGRSVRSPLCCAALEEAFRNTIMTGKFPSCVLSVSIDPSQIDANIHPAKTEVRFTNEKAVFDAIYFAAKNALMGYDESREIKLAPLPPVKGTDTGEMAEPEADAPSVLPIPSGRETVISTEEETPQKSAARQNPPTRFTYEQPFRMRKQPETAEQSYIPGLAPPEKKPEREPELSELPGFAYLSEKSFAKRAESEEPSDERAEPEYVPETIRVVGELFRTYILCESEQGMLLIDKHAAHERINFERFKKGFESCAQYLCEPCEVLLTPEEYDGVSEYADRLAQTGLIVELSDGNARVTALPQLLDREDPEDVLGSIAKIIVHGNTNAEGELFDDILHTMACKASIRANDITDMKELHALAQEVISNRDIRFCPHGRPVITQISKRQIERYFGRTT